MSGKIKFSPGQCCCPFACEDGGSRHSYCEMSAGPVATSDALNYLLDKTFPNGMCAYEVIVEVKFYYSSGSTESYYYYVDQATGKLGGTVSVGTSSHAKTPFINRAIVQVTDPDTTIVEVKVRSERTEVLTGANSLGNYIDDHFYLVDCGLVDCPDLDVEIPPSTPSDFETAMNAVRIRPPAYGYMAWGGTAPTSCAEPNYFTGSYPHPTPGYVDFTADENGYFSTSSLTAHLLRFKADGTPWKIYNSARQRYSEYSLTSVLWGTYSANPQPADSLGIQFLSCTDPNAQTWTAGGSVNLTKRVSFGGATVDAVRFATANISAGLYPGYSAWLMAEYGQDATSADNNFYYNYHINIGLTYTLELSSAVVHVLPPVATSVPPRIYVRSLFSNVATLSFVEDGEIDDSGNITGDYLSLGLYGDVENQTGESIAGTYSGTFNGAIPTPDNPGTFTGGAQIYTTAQAEYNRYLAEKRTLQAIISDSISGQSFNGPNGTNYILNGENGIGVAINGYG